jgi:hypothetical protein
MKVGDLVEMSHYGWKRSRYEHRHAKYGIVVDIMGDQVLMMSGRYKDVISYRVRWFDSQGNPLVALTGFERKSLKFLNKKKRSSV